MKITKNRRNDLIFLAIIVLLIIPQTRKPIQIMVQSVISKFSPSVIEEEDREVASFEDWKLEDIEGNLINFKDMKGKVVLLNLWATWCPPCIAELPSFQELYNDYHDKIEIILVSGERQSIVKGFLEKKAYSLKSYTPKSDYPNEFNARSIPRTFLIDKEGKIIINKVGAANWNSKKVRCLIDEALK